MLRSLGGGLAVTTAGAIAILIGGAAPAQAATKKAPPATRAYACISTAKHTFSAVKQASVCKRGQTKISWAINNASGATGKTGATGPAGPAGSPDTPQQVLDKLKSVDGAASGLDASTLAGVSLNALQLRVTGTCAAGQAIGAVGGDGTVTCVGTSATGTAGGDLTGSYPNPSIAPGAVTAADLHVPLAIDGGTSSKPLAVTGTAAGDAANADAASMLSGTVNNVNSLATGVRGSTNTIYGNLGAAGVYGSATGTGGVAVLANQTNSGGSGPAVRAQTVGHGAAITAQSVDGDGVTGSTTSGAAIHGIASAASGKAAVFEHTNASNTNAVVTATTVGDAPAVDAKTNLTTGTSPAVRGEVNSIFANFGTAGVEGIASGTGGYGGLFYSSNASGNGPAVLALTEGNGNGVTGSAGGNGNGVEGTTDGSGNGVYGWTPNFGTGKAGRFANFNNANGQPTVHITTTGTGSALLINHTGPSGNLATFQSGSANVARINKAGTGFFNGGTQSSGADVAEVVPTCSAAKPSEVVEIDAHKPDCFRLATHANSRLVAGVVSTDPGVTLNSRGAAKELAGPALALAGRVPVKVTGKIAIGDLLVASAVPGHAMAGPADPAVGTVIGKALEPSSGADNTIKMLVLSR